MNNNQFNLNGRVYRDLLSYLFILTGCFLFLEISFFLQCHLSHFSSFTIVTQSLQFPLTIIPGILYYFFSQALVHIGFTILIWCVAILVSIALNLPSSRVVSIGAFLWVLGILLVLTANQFYFPHSVFSELTRTLFVNSSISTVFFRILSFFAVIVSAIALFGLFRFAPKSTAAFGVLFTSMILALYVHTPAPIIDAASFEKPNIILIGVDSLRPDFLSFLGGEADTPFFDDFLKQSTVFAESVTPIARTFPSWAGILTGQYPRQSGIRTNLIDQRQFDYSDSLPSVLRRAGYATIFATDETRFSNIEPAIGFDRVVSPPMGFNDFLIGTLNDFPISNLIVNTRVGEWLFPHSYANRPVYFTYQPNSFINRLKPVLAAPRDKPLFFAIHFCLAHNPYQWADSPTEGLSVQQQYNHSVQMVDHQLRDFFSLLKQNRLLEHAIVIVLSDHGEALELPGDRITDAGLYVPADRRHQVKPPHFYPQSMDDEAINQSAGHGTDVLGLSQYHTLLAWRLYGVGQQYAGVVPGVVSLLDIKPTILDMVGLKKNLPVAVDSLQVSQSLAAIIRGQRQSLNQHYPIFLESDFSPRGIRSIHPEMDDVVIEGIHAFRIDPVTTHLLVKDPMVQMIIDSKQYAVIEGNWMLALYPQHHRDRQPILVNLVTGRWTDNLRTNFAQHSPALHMYALLKTFYGKDMHSAPR